MIDKIDLYRLLEEYENQDSILKQQLTFYEYCNLEMKSIELGSNRMFLNDMDIIRVPYDEIEGNSDIQPIPFEDCLYEKIRKKTCVMLEEEVLVHNVIFNEEKQEVLIVFNYGRCY